MESIRNLVNRVDIIASYVAKINFNNVLPRMTTSSKSRLPLSSSDINFVCTSHFQHTCYVIWKETILYLIILTTFGEEYQLWSSLWSNLLLEYYFMYLRSRYLHQHIVLKTCSSLRARDEVSHPYEAHCLLRFSYTKWNIVNYHWAFFTATWLRKIITGSQMSTINGTCEITRRDI
jgi:hypothetical protein